MSDENNNTGWGGSRKGAGRPKGTTGIKKKTAKGTTRRVFQVSCQPEEYEKLKELAENAGMNLSKYIVKSLLG